MRFCIWKLAFRYLFPKQRWGTFFTWVSVLGIVAGVTLLCVVLCIMSGFDKNIEEKLVQINGSVKILSSGIIHDYPTWLEKIKKRPHIKGITPFIQGVALIQKNDHVLFPKCFGFDVKTVEAVLPFSKFIQKDGRKNLGNGAFIPYGIAKELNLWEAKSTFDLYSPLALEAIKNEEIILPQEINVAGFFKTDWAEIDRNTILFPLAELQEAYGMAEESVHGFCLNVEDRYIAEVCRDLNHWLPHSMRAYAWHELNEDFLYVLKMEKTMCFFALLFIVVVAAFSISSGLLSLVRRKQREITLLRTWGAKRKEIFALFAIQSFWLATLGISLGFGISFCVLHYRNAIVQMLTGWFLPQNALWNFYDFAQLPVAYNGMDFVIILLFTYFITLVASFLPAWKAVRMPIIQGLRSE